MPLSKRPPMAEVDPAEDLDDIEVPYPSYRYEEDFQKVSPETSESDEESPRSSSTDSDDYEHHEQSFPIGDITCWKATRSPLDFIRLTAQWIVTNKSQVLSGVTVALAQVPEAVSFSFVAGVDPIVGLQSAWIMGICTSLAGGRPGMVAGATGAVAVVLTNLIEQEGIGTMFYAIMLAGILQMLFGFLRLGVVMRMVPHSVMVGFVNGLGIVIGLAQFNTFKVPASKLDEQDSKNHRHLSGVHIGGAFTPFTNGRPWVETSMLLWMIAQIVISIGVYIGFPKITKAIPGSLAAIIVSTIFEWAFIRQVGYETYTVEDLASVNGKFPVPVWLDESNGYSEILPPFDGRLIGKILPTAITAAVIGLLESLLTLQIIDELTNTKGSPNREAFGQGLGQFLSGMLGGMGGCTTIGQSLMNIHSGGFTRLSSSVAAFFMLLIILVAYPLINLIPIASLAGVMFLVTYFTIEWESGIIILGSCMPGSLRTRWGIHTKVKRSDLFVMLVVVAVTLVLDLAVAVGVGIVISCVVFAWDAGTRVHITRTLSDDRKSVTYELTGPIFFGSAKTIYELFPHPRDDPSEAIVLLEDAEIYDWSGMVAIKTLHDRFENNGTTVHFKKLSVASHTLMSKSKRLWEGVNVFREDDADDLDEDAVDVQFSDIHAANSYDAHL